MVWTKFACQTLRDYHNFNHCFDVYLLADVFEKFRADSQVPYELKPVHYHALPGLSWDAALKHSHVGLELITDINMYLLIEKGIRGGISMISHWYAKVKDPRMGDEYDASKPMITLIYLDANCLYLIAMCEPLPIDQFSMVDDPEEFDDTEYCYILEIDKYMPKEKHDTFNDYPLAPNKIPVIPDILSPDIFIK